MIAPRLFLFRLWLVFGTFGGVVSIASLAGDLVAWVDFIVDFLNAYRSLVDAFWGPIFSVLKIQVSRQIYDYLTLNSLAAVAVLWSLHNTARELAFPNLSSTAKVLVVGFLNFSLAVDTLESFKTKAKDKLSAIAPMDKGLASEIDIIGRPYRSILYAISNLAFTLMFVLSAFIATYGVPFVMWARDAFDMRQCRKLLTERKFEVAQSEIAEAYKPVVSLQLEIDFGNLLLFEKINKLYYSTIFRSQFWYYAGILVIFLLVVMLNYLYFEVILILENRNKN
jgi:hypothetical protein